MFARFRVSVAKVCRVHSTVGQDGTRIALTGSASLVIEHRRRSCPLEAELGVKQFKSQQ